MTEKTIPEDTQRIIDTVARFMKGFRWQNGYSKLELSKISGIHHNTISKIESGNSFTITSLIEVAMDLPLREIYWEV